MDTAIDNNSQLRTILCSLYYLSKETEGLGMQLIADVISSSICKIKAIMERHETKFDDLIIDEEAIRIMRFLYAYSSADESEKKDIVKALEFIENRRFSYN